MKYKLKGMTRWVAAGAFALFCVMARGAEPAVAAGYGLTMAPMNQTIIIDPGDSYQTSFRISNPSASTQDTFYKLEAGPFYVSEEGGIVHGAENDSGEIAKWITFDVPTEGKLAPNDAKEIKFTISVPDAAPAGGQYVAISVTASNSPDGEGASSNESESGSGAAIKEERKMTHLVYAEITGNTVKSGEIFDVKVPSFLLSGDISGMATVRNTGNVHGNAEYKLQVYPLFSSEEVYTNEEKPISSIILPNRERFQEVSWEGTPAIGIFNVVFTVEFAGEMQRISKMVIVCPLWLLFIIVFAIVAIIIWLVLRAKARKGNRAA